MEIHLPQMKGVMTSSLLKLDVQMDSRLRMDSVSLLHHLVHLLRLHWPHRSHSPPQASPVLLHPHLRLQHPQVIPHLIHPLLQLHSPPQAIPVLPPQVIPVLLHPHLRLQHPQVIPVLPHPFLQLHSHPQAIPVLLHPHLQPSPLPQHTPSVSLASLQWIPSAFPSPNQQPLGLKPTQLAPPSLTTNPAG